MSPSLISSLCLSTALLALPCLFFKKTNHLILSGIALLFSLLLNGLVIATVIDSHWQAPGWLSIGAFPLTFALDNLTVTFLFLLSGLACAAAIFSPGYLKHLDGSVHSGLHWAAYLIFLTSMALVILSADAVTFLVFWELMSLSSCALVATEHRNHSVQKAALIYLGSTRVATGFLAAGFFWMYSLSKSWSFADWHFSSAFSNIAGTAASNISTNPIGLGNLASGSLHIPECHIAALLIFLGLAIKAGIWPFHIWLPYAHPAAPSTVSALMSGVMIKIALYGMIRILVLRDLDSDLLGYLAIFLGTVSAFWGVLFALIQTDLKKTLAYSSVENVGLILLAIGICIVAKVNGVIAVSAIALSAALFHSVGHGVFKALLFLGSGTVHGATHTLQIGNLGGLTKRMPWTSACFLVGCMSVCALPPLNGFIGKWMLYQSLMQNTWSVNSPVVAGLSLGVVCVLALVGGLSIACFANAYSVSFLGEPRSSATAHATDGDIGSTTSQIFLAALCLLLGILAQPIITFFKPICDSALHANTEVASVMQFSMASVVLTFASIFALIYLIVLKPSKVRRGIIWECGFGSVSARAQVTADSFAQPIARIFNKLLCYSVSCEIEGTDRRHFPEKITVAPQTASLIESRIYQPGLKLISFAARSLAKLQSGSIHLYLTYLCLTLIALLLVGRSF
jgi:hydrogenase-4 component B